MKKDFSLGQWQINCSEGTIRSTEESRRVEPKVLSVLMALADAEGQVVSREELLDRVWPNQVVGDDVINSSIATLRKALGDDRKHNCYIRTVPKKGYMLVKPVQWDNELASIKKDYQVTPPQKILLISAILIFLISLLYVVTIPNQQNTSAIKDELSIAVLPFEIFSADNDIEYFADGLAEEMLHQLVINPKLKVMSRSASFKYQNSDKNLTTIAKELNVKYLIQGSVRIQDNSFRIIVQLIDAKNNFHLWSRVFDDSSGELFKIQQQVAGAVADMLNISDGSQQVSSIRNHPESEEAYKYFVMAQSFVKVGGGSAYEKAISLYDKAIALSPTYALAYTGKAVSYLLQYQYRHINKHRAIAEARSALDKALQIEPNLAEAYAAKGLMYTYLKSYKQAENFYLKALELHPNLRLAHNNYSFLLWQESRFKLAIQHAEKALSTAPLSGNSYFIIGDSLASLAQFDKAITNYKHCQEVLPKSVGCRAGLANLYQLMGKMESAKQAIEESATVSAADDFWHNNTYASLLIHQGHFDEALKILKQTSKQNATDYFLLRTLWLVALAQNKIEDYFVHINKLAKNFPNDMDVKKFQALNAYWNNDYHLAVKLYEEALTNSSLFMFNLWDYSDGLSHANNLARSYDKIDQQEKKQKLLMQIDQHIKSYPEQLEQVPGGLYIKSQYYYLTDEQTKSEKLLLQLKQKWSLNWLPTKDVFW